MGRSLAEALTLSGYQVQTWSRVGNLGADGKYLWPAMGAISICFICVSDDAIEAVACEFSQALAGATPHVLHCAGALGLEPLAALSELGCPSAVFHPVQSMTGAASDLNKAWCVCHGDKTTLEILNSMVQRMGGYFVERNSQGHAVYHAAAVLAEILQRHSWMLAYGFSMRFRSHQNWPKECSYSLSAVRLIICRNYRLEIHLQDRLQGQTLTRFLGT